jgi:hypothetical protein
MCRTVWIKFGCDLSSGVVTFLSVCSWILLFVVIEKERERVCEILVISVLSIISREGLQ